jgi:uncharacterized lipoprotein YajG
MNPDPHFPEHKDAATFIACLIAIIVLSVMLTGCVMPPATQISSGAFSLTAPKNLTAQGVEITKDAHGTIAVRIDRIVSTNSPQVIDSTAAGQAAMLSELRSLMQTLIDAGKAAAK